MGTCCGVGTIPEEWIECAAEKHQPTGGVLGKGVKMVIALGNDRQINATRQGRINTAETAVSRDALALEKRKGAGEVDNPARADGEQLVLGLIIMGSCLCADSL